MAIVLEHHYPSSCRRLLLMWHSRLRWHRILSASLLLLHVLLIGHLLLLLGGDVVRLHAGTSRHAGLRRWDLRVIYVFGRVDGGFPINAVLVARGRLGRVQACLEVEMLADGPE